jgi:hypothetical protein
MRAIHTKVLACVLTALLAACADPPAQLTSEEAADLVRAGDVINARHTAALEPIYPPAPAWPPAVVRLQPQIVRVEPAMGVYFRLHDGWFRESGYFVPLKPVWKKRDGDPYEEVAPGLYWYRMRN